MVVIKEARVAAEEPAQRGVDDEDDGPAEKHGLDDVEHPSHALDADRSDPRDRDPPLECKSMQQPRRRGAAIVKEEPCLVVEVGTTPSSSLRELLFSRHTDEDELPFVRDMMTAGTARRYSTEVMPR